MRSPKKPLNSPDKQMASCKSKHPQKYNGKQTKFTAYLQNKRMCFIPHFTAVPRRCFLEAKSTEEKNSPTENLEITQPGSSRTGLSFLTIATTIVGSEQALLGSSSLFRLICSLEFINFYMDYGYLILILSISIYNKYKNEGWLKSRYKITSLRY